MPSAKQRQALEFLINNALRDDAYGLSPQLVQHLGLQFFPDGPGSDAWEMDPSFEVHDLVAGVQAFALTMVVNPTTLRRLYDNEFRTNGSEENPVTLAEVLTRVTDEIWGDLKPAGGDKYSAAKPMLSASAAICSGSIWSA